MDVEFIIARDLYAHNKVINFEPAEAAKLMQPPPPLAAVSFFCSQKELPRDLDEMEVVCAHHASKLVNRILLEEVQLWLFVAHGPWQPESAIVLHNRLWKSFPREWNLPSALHSVEIRFQSEQGIRFAGVALLPISDFPVVASILRRNPSCALILSGRSDVATEHGIRDLFSAAFPTRRKFPQAFVDWLSISVECCPRNDVIVRSAGSFDEREISIDFIMTPSRLLALGNSIYAQGCSQNAVEQ